MRIGLRIMSLLKQRKTEVESRNFDTDSGALGRDTEVDFACQKVVTDNSCMYTVAPLLSTGWGRKNGPQENSYKSVMVHDN